MRWRHAQHGGPWQTGRMREVFAHEAVLDMAPDADAQAPGAAITAALCGHWDHEPPCPLAPHHTCAARVGGELHVRTLFAVEPTFYSDVRERIDRALAAEHLSGPDGVTARWQLLGSHRSDVAPDETDDAQRLRASG